MPSSPSSLSAVSSNVTLYDPSASPSLSSNDSTGSERRARLQELLASARLPSDDPASLYYFPPIVDRVETPLTGTPFSVSANPTTHFDTTPLGSNLSTPQLSPTVGNLNPTPPLAHSPPLVGDLSSVTEASSAVSSPPLHSSNSPATEAHLSAEDRELAPELSTHIARPSTPDIHTSAEVANISTPEGRRPSAVINLVTPENHHSPPTMHQSVCPSTVVVDLITPDRPSPPTGAVDQAVANSKNSAVDPLTPSQICNRSPSTQSPNILNKVLNILHTPRAETPSPTRAYAPRTTPSRVAHHRGQKTRRCCSGKRRAQTLSPRDKRRAREFLDARCAERGSGLDYGLTPSPRRGEASGSNRMMRRGRGTAVASGSGHSIHQYPDDSVFGPGTTPEIATILESSTASATVANPSVCGPHWQDEASPQTVLSPDMESHTGNAGPPFNGTSTSVEDVPHGPVLENTQGADGMPGEPSGDHASYHGTSTNGTENGHGEGPNGERELTFGEGLGYLGAVLRDARAEITVSLDRQTANDRVYYRRRLEQGERELDLKEKKLKLKKRELKMLQDSINQQRAPARDDPAVREQGSTGSVAERYYAILHELEEILRALPLREGHTRHDRLRLETTNAISIVLQALRNLNEHQG